MTSVSFGEQPRDSCDVWLKVGKIGDNTRAHHMDKIWTKGFHPRKFLAVKSPVGKDDGHFRIKRKRDAAERHNVITGGNRFVTGDP